MASIVPGAGILYVATIYVGEVPAGNGPSIKIVGMTCLSNFPKPTNLEATFVTGNRSTRSRLALHQGAAVNNPAHTDIAASFFSKDEL